MSAHFSAKSPVRGYDRGMCFNMTLLTEMKELEQEFRALFEEISFSPAAGISGFSHPSWPIIPAEHPGSARMVRWGLIPSWARTREEAQKLRKATLNARLETAWDLPSFRNSIGPRRCLIPVDGFYEPFHHEGSSYPFYLHRRDRKLFALGGIYDRWNDPETNRRYATFSILTTDARGIVSVIHNRKQRMPLMISSEDYQRWLDPNLDRQEVLSLAEREPDDQLTAYPVSSQLYARSGKQQDDLTKPWNYGIESVDRLIAL